MKKPKIKYCRLGLSNRYENYIEINQKLKRKKYKKLRNYIIKHEEGHTLNEFDLFHEFKIPPRIIPRLLWFIITTPETWIDFFPIQYKNKKLIYDSNMLILYIMIIAIIFGYYLII